MSKVNLILLGESGVGKSTLLHRFKTGEFKGLNNIDVTHVVEFSVKKIYLEGKEISIFIWDTAGKERYNSLVRSYYRQGEGVLLVYDVTNPTSFYKLSKWLCDLKDINENAEILIAGNKNEDKTKKAVAVSMVKNFAKEENLEYMEVSAMSGSNVENAFLRLTKKVLIAKGILAEDKEILASNGSSADKTSLAIVPCEDKDKIVLGVTPVVAKKKKSCC